MRAVATHEVLSATGLMYGTCCTTCCTMCRATYLLHTVKVRPQLQLPVHGDGQLAQEGQALGAGVAPRLGIGVLHLCYNSGVAATRQQGGEGFAKEVALDLLGPVY